MDKNQIGKFAKEQIAKFQNPKYNPYEFENYIAGLAKLGFRSEAASFVRKHPEIVTDGDINTEGAAFRQAINAEQDITTLGNFIFAYACNEAKSAWYAAGINYKSQIEPLKALTKLCE